MNKADFIALRKSHDTFRNRFPEFNTTKAIICGTGWSGITDSMEVVRTAPFNLFPGLGMTSVAGHDGEIAYCRDGDQEVVVFKGRRHLYEGEGWAPVAVPVYICKEAGIKDILLTNSAGAINLDMEVGDMMAITDHFNAMGDNPLVGEHQPDWGPRFPDMTNIYDHEGLEVLTRAASRAGVELKQGIYFATRGPMYETPTEIRAYRALGADAVGMSTVPEAILAHSFGIRVAAVSCMTNFAAGLAGVPLSHEEVTAATAENMPKMTALLREWVRG